MQNIYKNKVNIFTKKYSTVQHSKCCGQLVQGGVILFIITAVINVR